MMDAPVVVIVVFLLQVSISESLVKVQTAQPYPVVHMGSEVLLQCSFTVTSGAIDVKQLTVNWIQYALTVAKYDQEDLIERPRLSLNVEGMKSGNASLLIRSVSFDDGGQYRCAVQHKGEEGDVDIYVSVRATPQVSIKLETNLSLSQGVVTCEAVSFYPQAISFNITRKGDSLKTERLTSDQSPSRWRLPDGSFSARSVYTFDASDIRNSRDTMSCEVTHASVDQPITVSTTPGVPVVSLVLLHASQVVCRAKNFYPSEVVFTWRRSEEVMKSETPQASLSPTGTFTAESSLEFTPYSRDRVSCQVEHMTGASERKYVTSSWLTAGETAGIVVAIILLSLLLILLVALLWCSVMLSPLVVGSSVKSLPRLLECTLTGWGLKLVDVKWFKNDQFICEPNLKWTLEEEVLMPLNHRPDYSAERRPLSKLCCNGEHVLELKIKEKSLDLLTAVFTCRATHRLTRRTVERTFSVAEYIKPIVSEICIDTTHKEGDVSLNVTVSDYRHLEWTIMWTVDGKTRKEEMRSENFDEKLEMYITESVCRVTKDEYFNSNIRAEIRHDVLKEPIKRTFNKVPFNCTVKCLMCPDPSNISLLFCKVEGPMLDKPEVQVTWWRSNEDGSNKVTAGSDGWKIEKNSEKSYYVRTADNTFTYVQCCRFERKDKSEEKMKYNCEVKYPGQEKPCVCQVMPTTLKFSKPVIRGPQEVLWTEDLCVLQCVSSGNYPLENIKIKWIRRKKEGGDEEEAEEWPAKVIENVPWMDVNEYQVMSQVEFKPKSKYEMSNMKYYFRAESELTE